MHTDEVAGEVDGAEVGEGRDHGHDLEAHAGDVRHGREAVEGLDDAVKPGIYVYLYISPLLLAGLRLPFLHAHVR